MSKNRQLSIEYIQKEILNKKVEDAVAIKKARAKNDKKRIEFMNEFKMINFQKNQMKLHLKNCQDKLYQN